MLQAKQLSLHIGARCLFEEGNFQIFAKQKVGIIGRNGCGKSTLFKLILGEMHASQGQLDIQSGIRISHMAQEFPDQPISALDFVLSGDAEYHSIMERLAKAERQQNHEDVLFCQNWLSENEGFAKPAKAGSIMAGLGFDFAQQALPLHRFSGGWRMRLALARCLMAPADLYLLDEPTNHLDLEAIFWLERWLKQLPAAILIVSHDRAFLDAIVGDILHFDQERIALYKGNYSRFEILRAERLSLQSALHEKQQKQIAHMQSFINRFKAKASKAKQAQSRVKALERMDIIAKAQADSPFHFAFAKPPACANPLMNLKRVNLAYDTENPILQHINFSIAQNDRIALLGANGQGKSTLVKALVGSLNPQSGEIHRADKLGIGYFAQHQLETLHGESSAMQTILELSPNAKEQEIRSFLGGFNFVGDMVFQPIAQFSGGEKARLVLAKLVWQKPNILLLDEPTNHLDMDMRAALELALQEFEGAVVLISHDRHLLESAVDHFYLVHDKTINAFDGDLEDYQQWLQKQGSATANQTAATPAKTQRVNEYKDKKASNNRLKRLESQLEEKQQRKRVLETELMQSEYYQPGMEDACRTRQVELAAITAEIQVLESEWLELADQLGM